MIARQHNLKTPSGEDVHVMEVPNTFFENVQVCLAVKDKKDIKKCRWLIPRFKKFLDDATRSNRRGLIIGGNN